MKPIKDVAPLLSQAQVHPIISGLILLGLFIVIALLLVATQPQPEPQLEELPPLAVNTVALERRSVPPYAPTTGRLQPARQAVLRFEVVGQLRRRAVEPGATVAAGDVLLELDDRDFRDRVRSAEADLDLERSRIARDRVQLEHTVRQRDLQEREVERSRELADRGLLSESSVNQVESRLSEIESRVAALTHDVTAADLRIAQKQSQADQAMRDLERATLLAPFDGRINAVAPEVGDRVTGSDVVVELVDVSTLDFYVEVDGGAAAAVALGDTLSVTTEHGVSAEGDLVALQTNPNTQTFTHALRVRIPGEGLLPGQTARTIIPLVTLYDAWTVPASAILARAGQTAIYRVFEDQLRLVPVQLGPRVGNLQVVDGEFERGWEIVTTNVASLDPYRRVQIREEDDFL